MSKQLEFPAPDRVALTIRLKELQAERKAICLAIKQLRKELVHLKHREKKAIAKNAHHSKS